jgi:7-cyano-7-deazaguanine reductase
MKERRFRMQKFKALKEKKEFKFNGPDPAQLETFPNPGVSEVTLICKEFTSHCPITSQPDYAVITILYEPNNLCLESKSLKLYLGGFRNWGAFAEQLSVTISKDLCSVLQCPVVVEVDQASRGGIEIQAIAKEGADDKVCF